jgi:two-component system, NarL family, response regulator DevR
VWRRPSHALLQPHIPVTARRRPGARTDPLVTQVFAHATDAEAARHTRRAPTEPPIRLLIVDTQRVVLLGLATLFGAARNCQVVGEVTTAQQAVEETRARQPEVVLMDADLPGNAGIIASQLILTDSPMTRVIMLATTTDPEMVVTAIHAGVRGYLLKRTDPPRLVEAVEIVAGGGYFFEDAVTQPVLEWLRAGQPAADPVEHLSQQERRILRLIADGKTNRDIAATLSLSEYTVKTYVSAALRKLGLTSRAEAAAFIIRSEASSSK